MRSSSNLLFLFVAASLTVSGTAHSQTDFPIEEWVYRYNGTGDSFDEGKAVAMDVDGNVFVAAWCTLPGQWDGDYVTIKLDPSGNLLWMQRLDGTAHDDDYPVELVIDGSGNVIVTGYSKGIGDGYDYFTVKYDTDGELCWSARYDVYGYDDYARDIAVDASGNIYVTGRTGYSEGHSYFTTIKYSSAGEQLWLRNMTPPSGMNGAAAIAVDGSGNVYVTGWSDDAGYDVNYATVKYNSAGVEQWVRYYSTTGDDEATDIALDPAGNVLVTGTSYSDTSERDFLTLKYNPAGALQWAARYDSNGGADEAFEVCTDPFGNIVVMGHCGFYYGALVKYSPAGALLWSSIRPEYCYWADMEVSSGGNIYVTGQKGSIPSDIMTILYDSSGVEQWVAFYDASSFSEEAHAIVVAPDGDFCVTCDSWGSGSRADLVTIMYDGNTGVEAGGQDAASSLSVVPNPSMSSPVILIDLPEPAECTVSVYSLDGRLVETVHASVLAAEGTTLVWDAAGCPAGVYLVVAKTIDRTLSERVILLR